LVFLPPLDRLTGGSTAPLPPRGYEPDDEPTAAGGGAGKGKSGFETGGNGFDSGGSSVGSSEIAPDGPENPATPKGPDCVAGGIMGAEERVEVNELGGAL
jgi:hypothetical protein